MLDTPAPRHIIDAIELVHRKALNENIRRRAERSDAPVTGVISATIDRAEAAEIEESDRELRLVTDALRQYRELYGRTEENG